MVKSKQFNVLFSSSNFSVSWNIELESQHFEFRSWNNKLLQGATIAKNNLEMLILCNERMNSSEFQVQKSWD